MKIILAVDGSPHSAWAVDLLRKLPLAGEPEITVMHVVDLSQRLPAALSSSMPAPRYREIVGREMERSRKAADQFISRAVERLRRRWKKVQPLIEEGNPAVKIISEAKRARADLIILGSRGLSNIKAFLMGSVSLKVTMYAPCSVLVTHQRIGALKRILLAVDGSDDSRAATHYLKSNFSPAGIQVSVLNVWNPPFVLQHLIEATLKRSDCNALIRTGFQAAAKSLVGHPAAKIIETARQNRVDLVMVGSRGITGLKKFLLGSVSQKVMKYSPCPVLIVRSQLI